MFQRANRPGRRVDKPRSVAIGDTCDPGIPTIGTDRPQNLPKRRFTLATHNHVDPERWIGVGLRREAGIVASDHDAGLWTQHADEADQRVRCTSLKGHYAETDHGWRC